MSCGTKPVYPPDGLTVTNVFPDVLVSEALVTVSAIFQCPVSRAMVAGLDPAPKAIVDPFRVFVAAHDRDVIVVIDVSVAVTIVGGVPEVLLNVNEGTGGAPSYIS
jgi:hypothetical protein